MSSKIKRYAVCGVSARAIWMFIKPIVEKFSESAQVVALLDIDPLRFKVCKEAIPETADLPEYMPDQVDKMIEETKPDALLVVCKDCFHVDYILKGLEHGLDVVSEKPMCTNIEDVVKVCRAEKMSKGRVICTFNYRYAPVHRKLRELILEGRIGRITHVDLNWYIDIKHGSSYFNRWNRLRENSGSLSIHKSSHHFDLVNWWVDGIPESVHAFGALNHYGPDGEFNPSRKDGRHCSGCEEKRQCAYLARWRTRAQIQRVHDDHLDAFDMERPDRLYSPEHYRPDKCIFDSEINIHDTYIANVRYRNGVLLNYSANFSTPWEGYRLAVNGTRGRLETEQWGGVGSVSFPMPDERRFIDVYPIFESRERIWLKDGNGGHGGGDPVILEDIFLGEDPLRKYKILADTQDALRSLSIGDAVYNSIMQDRIIRMKDTVPEDLWNSRNS